MSVSKGVRRLQRKTSCLEECSVSKRKGEEASRDVEVFVERCEGERESSRSVSVSVRPKRRWTAQSHPPSIGLLGPDSQGLGVLGTAGAASNNSHNTWADLIDWHCDYLGLVYAGLLSTTIYGRRAAPDE